MMDKGVVHACMHEGMHACMPLFYPCSPSSLMHLLSLLSPHYLVTEHIRSEVNRVGGAVPGGTLVV
jgi:hypothetical protein